MVLGLGGHPEPRQCLFRPPARPGPHRGTPGAPTHWQVPQDSPLGRAQARRASGISV